MTHSFETSVAEECGVNAAVVLQYIFYWCLHNKMNGLNYFDGLWWIYNSAVAFKDTYPYLSEKQIRTALGVLKDKGYILVGNHNENPYDRTLWYALTEKGYKAFGDTTEGARNEESQKEEPKKKDKEKAKVPKHKYGEFGNVLLTDVERDRLIDELGESMFGKCVNFLDQYIEEKGYKSKSHNLAIRRWVIKAVQGNKKQSTATGYDWDAL